MDTILLDTATWDLVLDVNSNIAVASTPYATAQDVASACRTFQGELWLDTTSGVPWFGAGTTVASQQQRLGRGRTILGLPPAAGYIKAQLVAQSIKVPGVASATVFLTGLNAQRELTGQIQIVPTATPTTTLVVSINPWYISAITP